MSEIQERYSPKLLRTSFAARICWSSRVVCETSLAFADIVDGR